eukprot:3744775-Rhodomonas_salina.1
MDELYFVVPEEMDDWAGEKCPALGSAVFWRKTMIAFYGAVKLTGAEDEIESINDPILGAATYITVNFCLSVGTAYLAFKDAHKKFLEWGIWEE